MTDFRVMQWHSAMDGPWSAEAERRFRERGYDGLAVVPSKAWTPPNLDFVRELDGLRLFRFSGKVRDDLAVFEVPGLEDLTLVTGSRRAVPEVVQPKLSALVLSDRPGLFVAARWPGLATVRVGGWKGQDLGVLAGAGRLASAYLEGRRQQGTLDGVEGCAAIESLLLVNYSVASTEPLRGLDALREVKLLAARPTPAHGALDLSAFTSRHLAKIWISNASALLNPGALAQLPALRELRLLGCPLTEADRAAIAALPKHVAVQILDD